MRVERKERNEEGDEKGSVGEQSIHSMKPYLSHKQL